MKRKIRYYRLIWLKYDLPAGLSVFFVALPLCLGIALASGAPVYAGLLSGIIGGIIVSLISGSHLAVSGPAAGLTTLVAATIIGLGDYRLFLLSVMVAGLFQLLLGIFKLGGIANYFPSSVIKGMLAAIGILLICKQVPLALGYDKPDFWTGGLPRLFANRHALGNIETFNYHITRGALLITAISLAIHLIFQQPFAKKIKIVPEPLVIVVAGMVTSYLFTVITSGFSLNQTQTINLPMNIFAEIRFPDLREIFSSALIWKNGFVIGLLATLETLLCIEAIDKLDPHNRITPPNRELVAQGVGNILCGLLGAIPMTAVVVRGAANADAGARTKLSAFTHGLFLIIAVLFLPVVLNKIPYASLAAVLLITGYNLTKPKLYRNMWSLGWKQFVPFLLTIIMILVFDLLVGVSIGLAISIYFIVRNNFKAEYRISSIVRDNQEEYFMRLNSNVTFLNKVKLKQALENIPDNSVLTIDGSACNFIDYDILEIISEYDNKAKDRNIIVHAQGIEKVSITAIH